MIRLLIALAFLMPALAHGFDRDELVGTWVYETAYTEYADGHRVSQFSDRPRGIFIILPNGHYSHVIMANDLPRVGANLLKETTCTESEAIAEGTLAHFGTWTLDPGGRSFTVHITKSSYPNFDGVRQTRQIIRLDKTTLSYVNPVTTSGQKAKVVAVLRRLP